MAPSSYLDSSLYSSLTGHGRRRKVRRGRGPISSLLGLVGLGRKRRVRRRVGGASRVSRVSRISMNALGGGRRRRRRRIGGRGKLSDFLKKAGGYARIAGAYTLPALIAAVAGKAGSSLGSKLFGGRRRRRRTTLKSRLMGGRRRVRRGRGVFLV